MNMNLMRQHIWKKIKMKSKKVIATGLLAGFFMLAAGEVCFAAGGDVISEKTQVSVWKSEESKLEYQVETGSEIVFSLDAGEQEKEYEVCVLNMTSDSLLSYGSTEAFLVDYQYTGNKPLYLQMVFHDIDGNKTESREKMQYVIEREDGFSLYQAVNGNILISPGSGTVYLHWEEMNAENVKRNRIYGVSFLFLVEKGTEGTFVTSAVTGVDNAITQEMETFADYMFIGNDEVRIPEMGEYRYAYSTEGEEEIHFGLREQAEGCSVTADGILTITDEAKPGNLVLEGKLGEYLILSKNITVLGNFRKDIDKEALKNVENPLMEAEALQNPELQRDVSKVVGIVLGIVILIFAEIKFTIYKKEKERVEKY